jgi:hypothetical protein
MRQHPAQMIPHGPAARCTGVSIDGIRTWRNEERTVPEMGKDVPVIIFILLVTVVPWLLLAFFGIGPVPIADGSAPGQVATGASGPPGQALADGRVASSTSTGEAAVPVASGTAAADVGVGIPAHAG